MPMSASVTENKVPGIIRDLPELLRAVLRKSAFDIEREAKASAPVDTGALRASIYVAFSGESTYAESAAEAQALSSAGSSKQGKGIGRQTSAEVLPEVKPDGDMTAYIAVAAGHGAPVEYGTERQAAHPYLNPAADRVRPAFEAAVMQALRKAAE